MLPQQQFSRIQQRYRLLFLFLSFPIAAVSMSSSLAARKYDLVIYGATGFTGRLAAEYVVQHYPNLSFALAGRNLSKLKALRTELQSQKEIPLLVADAVTDPDSLQALAASTKVIANYAGTPFIDKALPVVQACVQHGTCYTDITGEVVLQRASYDRYHTQAVASKSLILHACGYDSIPSDLGAMLAAKEMQERHGCKCASIQYVASAASKGGASGGTIHTALGLLFGADADMPGLRETKARGSYALDPEGATGGPDTTDSVGFGVQYDTVSQQYVVPFIMAAANAPVVRKTNALLNYRYGKQCTYREVQAVPNLVSGVGQLAGLSVFGLLLVFPPTRWLLMQYVLPKPGEGPSREVQETGYFASHLYAVGDTPDKPITVAFVKSGNAGDPGYKATARMSIEASLCMAIEREKCAASADGGVLTPAAGLGQVLVDRLNKTGMQLGVLDAGAKA